MILPSARTRHDIPGPGVGKIGVDGPCNSPARQEYCRASKLTCEARKSSRNVGIAAAISNAVCKI